MATASSLLLLIQAASGPPPPAIELPAAAKLSALPPCPRDASGGDVVVCARRSENPYRLPKLGDPPNGPPLPPMTVKIPGVGTANADMEAGSVGGIPTNRAMVHLRIPF